jgi:hypothetical protein
MPGRTVVYLRTARAGPDVIERGVTLHLASEQREYSGDDDRHSLLTALAQRRPSP